MMAAPAPRGGWLIMLTLLLALLLSVAPMPAFMDIGRPLWLALFLSFWVLSVPHRLGLTTAWLFGLAEDVLYGSLLGQNALILCLVCAMVLGLQQRLRVFPQWQQALPAMRQALRKIRQQPASRRIRPAGAGQAPVRG